MVTAHNQNEIDAKAKAMADLLLQAVLEPGMVAPAWEACSRVREELARRHPVHAADVPTTEHVNWLLFEVTAFAAFIVIGHESPKWLTRRNALGAEEPDVEWIRYFNTQFLKRLADHLEASDLTVDADPTIRVEGRVAGYLRAGSSVAAAQDFSRFAASAMDSEHAALLQPIGLRLVESVVGVSRILLKGVFSRQLTGG